MASDVTHGAATRDAQAEVVKTNIDAGDSYGKIVVFDENNEALVTFTLSKPATSRSGAILTFLGLPIAVNAEETGTAHHAEAQDSNGTKVVGGTCGTSDADFIISNASIEAGQEIQLFSAVYESAE